MSSALVMGAAMAVATATGAEDRPTLYTVATAHLDTQWNWTIKDTIDKFIPDTLKRNFALFEKYPDYVFNFEGAFRYQLAKEYYPELYAELVEYVKAGRWRVAGSSWDAVDSNIPSPESLFRNILYGEGYFAKEFGLRSRDIFLPDCFGFGYALPSIAASSGLLGFSTQKLSWGSAYGIPFDIGKWTGPDGSSVAAALNAGDYTGSIKGDLSGDSGWADRIGNNYFSSGVAAGYLYHGAGDQGGAPQASSVANMEKSIKSKGPVRVLSAASDQLFRDLTADQWNALQEYDGELLMSTHGTGAYTSRAISKRWNRRNEVLGDSAERVRVAADWMGALAYPKAALTDAWKRFLWHQFHDDITGTSIPEAYQFSWNDYILSLNAFSAEMTAGVGAVAKAMDTRAEGLPLLVYNPLSHARSDVVEAVVDLPKEGSLKVYGPNGKEVPSQVTADGGTLTFLADMPPVSFAVYDVRTTKTGSAMATGLRVDRSGLENGRYKVVLDANGDISEIYDKRNARQMLSAPLRWEMLNDQSESWPAWEVLHKAVTAKPRGYVSGPAEVRVVENGPARVALEVKRKAGASVFVQRIRLSAGELADRVEVECRVDWYSGNTLLKATFPVRVSNSLATYNLGLGTIKRGNNTASLYEVPAQQWADLTDTSGKYGVTIMSDCKYGWDKPSDNALRLTLLHTPSGKFNQQQVQDFGENRFSYAVYGHAGDSSAASSSAKAESFGSPLMAFAVPAHAGSLGRSYSFASTDRPRVGVMALKKAEDGDEVIVRMQESSGKAVSSVSLRVGAGIASAKEVNAQEEPMGPATVKEGLLVADFGAYRNRTFALTLKPFGGPVAQANAKGDAKAQPLDLPYDTDVFSSDGNRKDGVVPGTGYSMPSELVPAEVSAGNVTYRMGPRADGKPNAVICQGQTIALPSGTKSLYVLAASTKGDTVASFSFAGEGAPVRATVRVQDIAENIGQWDNYALGIFGRIKRDTVAWVGTHRHTAKANASYAFNYLFSYRLGIPAGVTSVTLPSGNGVLIMAMTAGCDGVEPAVPVTALYDVREPAELKALKVTGGAGSGSYPVGTRVAISAEVPVGYTFVGWEGAGVDSPSSPVAMVVVGAGPGAVKATFQSLGTNVALGKRAKANQNVGGEGPERAVDGSVDPYANSSDSGGKGNSKWCSTEGDAKWLTVDLAQTYAISRWVVRHAGAGGEDRGWNTKDFELQVSQDGKAWTTADKVRGNTQDVTTREVTPVRARYVRLYITNTGSGKAARIYEFEVYVD